MADRSVPPEAIQALLVLMGQDHTFDDAILQSVQAQEPRLLHVRFVEDVKRRMPTEMQAAVQPVILGVISMSRGREEFGIPVEDFVRDIVGAAGLNATPEQQDRLFALISRLLSTPSLAITAKAYDLLTENDANFHSARVVTDLRPIFADTTDKPTVAAIVHSLRLRVGSSQEVRDIYVALDEVDIGRLQDTLARAQGKASTLRRSYPDLKFLVLSEEAM